MSSIQIVFRRAQERDHADLFEQYQQPGVYSGTLQMPYPSEQLWKKRLSEENSGHTTFVAEVDGKVVGHAGVSLLTHIRRRHVATLGMAVHDDWQGKGIGSQMLEKILEYIDNWLNVHRVELTVYSDNQAGIALYKRHGFVVEGEAKAYAFRNGEYVDALYMGRVR